MSGLNELSRDELVAIILAQQEQIATLTDQVTRLTARVKELEDRLGKDSHNSSKPPSSDGLRKKPRSQRGKSGRPSGGQQGHPGRTLEFAEEPDEVVVHAPELCQSCGATLQDAPVVDCERRQVFDLPPLSLVVTEHQVQTRCCSACGCSNRASFPEMVEQPAQYGPRIAALATYLSSYQMLPFEREAELFADVFDVHLSEGTLANFTRRAYGALDGVEKGIKNALCAADVLHVDETGLRIGAKLNWLHVTGNASLTFYACHKNRGRAALDEIGILSASSGRAVHDGWTAYESYSGPHALCNAHHLRELTAIDEQLQQAWAAQMKDLLLDIKRTVDQSKDRGRSRLHPLQVCKFEARYRAVLKSGHAANPPPAPTGNRGRPKLGPAGSLLKRLDEGQAAVLAFMYDFAAPFDNNLAERDLRMMKVKQKVSGCFRSDEGARAFCRIRGYISTMRKQGHNVLAVLQSVFQRRPVVPSAAA
jgi:transposase